MVNIDVNYVLEDRNGDTVAGFMDISDARYLATQVSCDASPQVFTIRDSEGTAWKYRNGEQVEGPGD